MKGENMEQIFSKITVLQQINKFLSNLSKQVRSEFRRLSLSNWCKNWS